MLILWLSFAMAMLDQGTKLLVQMHLHVGDFIEVIPRLFDLHDVQNTGAAWGLFAGFSHWLVVVSVVMLVVLVVFRRSIMADCLVHRFATAFMMGGIVGNLIDRVRLGYVIDFIDWHWFDVATWPTFNIADIGISVGVGLMVLQIIREEIEKRSSKAAPAPKGKKKKA